MNKQILRFAFFAIIIYLTSGTLSPAVAATQPSEEHGTHFCGVNNSQWNKRYADQFPNRNYARADTANLNAGEPRTVRMIYFLPNDRPYRVDVVQWLKDEISNIQNFYAEQMEAHGYGKITFHIETDFQGEPIVHHVDGQHPDSHYLNNTEDAVLDEVDRRFNLEANVYLIVTDNSIIGLDLGANRRADGIGSRQGKNGGYTLISRAFDFKLTAHELGHAFGLNHDFHDGAYIMSYGPGIRSFQLGRNRLSACHAEFLSVHPYFNLDIPIEEEEGPTIEFISPRTYPAGSQNVPVRLKVNDSDGLHQVLLFVSTIEPHFAAGFHEVKACRRLVDDRDTVVEFDYDGVIPSDGLTSLSEPVIHPIYVHAIDTAGNVGYTSFRLVEISAHHIATLEHAGLVHSVAFSPVDATLISSGSWDGTVKLWNVGTQENIATFHENGNVHSMAFSLDGATLATGLSGGGVELWNRATQQRIAPFAGHTETVESVAFSPVDATLLASGSWDGMVRLWDVTTHRDIAILKGHTDRVTSVAFSSDGAILASGSWDGMVKLWDVATHRDIGTLEGHTSEVNSVAFSPVDATLLATGVSDKTVKLWDVATHRDISTFEGHTDRVTSVAFSSDGSTVASGSWDRTVKLWDLTTQVNFATLGHEDRVFSVAFSGDDTTLASGTEGNRVELWDMSGLMGARLEARAEIDIPDPNLRAVIAEAIELPPSASIVRGHMATLTKLDASAASISNLAGLEDATKLTELKLWNNNISDISAVAGLTNLTRLNLGENNISDISTVAGLTRLQVLFLGNNNISDISAVARLTNLKELVLSDNNISDISAVAGLTNLTGLNLGENNISVISAVAGLVNLIALNSRQNPVSDISAVAGLTKLKWLWIDDNNISDISALAANTGLESEDTVGIRGNPLSYLSIHTHIPTLQSRRVTVQFDNQAHPALLEISGDNQKGASFASLSQPFVVEAQDANGSALAGISVKFTVTTGGGILSVTTTRTDPNGRAQSTLILGPNLGTNTVEVSAAGIESPATFYAIADTELSPLTADVNSDGLVNILDLILIASSLGQSGQNDADVNGDRVVSVLDLVLAAGMFEETAAAPSAQLQVLETVTAVEVQGWLTDARSLEPKDPIMKRGFVVLEQLLISLTPKETELLANYPNPFNPETWIPYRLAEDAFVTLTIYDLSGQVVRTLEVGHRIAAVYEGRSKAVYWDGRNGLGERVASGVYFYILTAGDYSATRKMVILK